VAEGRPLRPLDRPAQFLKGVGPRRAPLLARLGIATARDLLYHVPRRYVDASVVTPIAELEPGMEATVLGRVVSQGVLPTRSGLRVFQAIVRDRSGPIECAWPGQPYLERVIRPGDLLLLTGKVRFYHGRQLQPREYVILARQGEDVEARGMILPVYPATEGLSQRQLRRLIADNVEDLLRQVAEEEVLPEDVRRRYGLPSLPEALRALHQPQSRSDIEQGRRRLAFEELFFLQLLHAIARRQWQEAEGGLAMPPRGTLLRSFVEGLPFGLTRAQKRVAREILADMAAPRRMNRLLQGDVGAGKTVVAAMAMLRALENERQAAFMAPTELLAEQHARTLQRLLGALPVRVELLTGRTPPARRRRLLAELEAGTPMIVVGTHALIQEGVRFGGLGLAVIDEQHRFGVRQRQALREHSTRPDVLVMSATPIPRTLALTFYGDLDLSILDERPPGRRLVRTVLRPLAARPRVYAFVRDEVRRGRQAYLVYPLVEESEALAVESATEAYERLRREAFADLAVGLLHGQMPGEAKDAVMREFVEGRLQVLVATTVIEVGIDVPNATVMVIEHAERFGLSQLHQLRGRVGRGGEQSYCIVLSDAAEAAERLRIFAQTDDGFVLAREDLRLRGWGDLVGERQAGLPSLRFADLERDEALLEAARREAAALLAADPELERHPALRQALEARYGDRLPLVRVA